MSTVMWIGLGKMGLPMASRLVEAGHNVRGVEIDTIAAQLATDAGIAVYRDWRDAVGDTDVVVTMLPSGQHVSDVLTGPGKVFDHLKAGAVAIDSSTIDTGTAVALHAAAADAELHFVDAPVSGGVSGAVRGTLTFMVGGTPAAVTAATPVIDAMSAKIVPTGPGGTGQAAKIVNNLIFGVCLAATCEGVLLGQRLGLDPAVFYEIATSSTSDNFPLRNWYPAPGVVDSAPSNNGYQPGFTASLLLKDLTLAVEAAHDTGTPLASVKAVQRMFSDLVADGAGALDCTALFTSLSGTLDELQQPSTPRTKP